MLLCELNPTQFILDTTQRAQAAGAGVLADGCAAFLAISRRTAVRVAFIVLLSVRVRLAVTPRNGTAYCAAGWAPEEEEAAPTAAPAEEEASHASIRCDPARTSALRRLACAWSTE